MVAQHNPTGHTLMVVGECTRRTSHVGGRSSHLAVGVLILLVGPLILVPSSGLVMSLENVESFPNKQFYSLN